MPKITKSAAAVIAVTIMDQIKSTNMMVSQKNKRKILFGHQILKDI